jgi:sugar transferase (PEP-CTERM/EpsH1 system associated)
MGGLENVVFNLVRCCTADVVPACVLCLQEAGALAPQFERIGVAVETLSKPPGSIWKRVIQVAGALRRARADVLHTHNPGPHLHGALAAKLAGVPVLVHTKHGRNFVDRPLAVRLNRFAAALSDCVVAVSEDAARVALDLEKVSPTKVRIIRNGVDLDRFQYRPPRRSDEGIRAVTVARLDPIKDQVTLLRAVRLVVDKEPAFTLDIVGDGPSRPELELLRGTLGLARHVRFHGFQHDVQPYLAQSDYFVLSSLSEGIPLTLLEAMAVGLPGVATDVGGNREVVVSGETGYLVPAEAPGALADAMLLVQADPMGLDRMGRAARHRVDSMFALRDVVARYEGIYFECLARHRVREHGRAA